MAFTGRQILEAHVNRYDGGRRIIWSELSDKERENLLKAVRGEPEADLGGANLDGVDLSEAYLSGAYLRGANFSGADLSEACLSGADLRGAYLGGAYLGGANMSGANLIGAILSGANLRGVNLLKANLSDANFSGTNLSGVDLSDAYLSGANLRGAILPAAPKVEDLDGQILRLVESGKGELEMGKYHTCRTAHCRSGWAIKLAGEEGLALEKQYGPSVAGALIYYASTGHVPNFHATNEDALADIRERAAQGAA